MKKKVPFILTCLLTSVILAVCGPSQARRDEQATKIAASISTTQTAEAPTPTNTPTPTDTPTHTPTSTLTPVPIKSPTPTPTDTSTPVPIKSSTPAPTGTSTPTLVPTIPLEDLPGIPYPSDEDLSTAIQPYVKAMELDFESVHSGISYEIVKNYEGKAFVVVVTQEGTPLLIAFKDPDSGEWKWRETSLKKMAQIIDPNFEISLAITYEKELWEDTSYIRVLNKDFNTLVLTAGIAWKWFEPEPGSFNQWMLSDVSNQLRMIGRLEETTQLRRVHALIFAEQEPDWLLPGQYSREEAATILREHIIKVMSLFKDTTVTEWIVINEPYFKATEAVHGFDWVRTDPLYQIIGPDYIEMAFQIVRELDPDGVLIYNDTSNHSLENRGLPNGLYTELTITNVNRLKARGLIDGVGLQMHLDAAQPPSEEDLIRTMQNYGMPVYITELDVDLSNLRATQPERLATQADLYATVLRAAFKSAVCKSFGFWDIGDKYSWLVIYQNKPRSTEPTLFDDDFNPKPAYYALLRVMLDELKAR